MRVGSAAPPFSLERVLQAPEGAAADWGALRGRYVVLDFWATWCGPCVSSIPHMNEIADRFRDRPLQIVAITDEGEEVVRKFLDRRPMKAWIGLDDDSSMFTAYQADKLPHTVIVDPGGKVVAVTQPGALTVAGLRRLIDGADVALSTPDRSQITPVDAHLEEYVPPTVPAVNRPREQEAVFPARGPAPSGERVVEARPAELRPAEARPAELRPSDAEPNLLYVMIRPSTSAESSTTLGAGRLRAQAIPLSELVAIAYGVNPRQVSLAAAIPNLRYDVEVATPRGEMESFQPLLQQALVASFGFEIRRERRMTDVYYLAVPAGRIQTLASGSRSSPAISLTPGRLRATGIDMPTLASHLTETLGRLVIDATNLKGRFNIEVEWDASRPGAITVAFRNQTGLDLLSAKSHLEMLVVNPARIQSAAR